MILINMMLAIINLAIEEITADEARFLNRFELVDYIRKTTREVVGLSLAKPEKTKYANESVLDEKDRDQEKEGRKTEEISSDFSAKTDMLLAYVDRAYVDGSFKDKEGIMGKLGGVDAKVVDCGFDALFMTGPSRNERKHKKE